jgi:hypothetical protein
MANTEMHRVKLTINVTHSVNFSFVSICGDFRIGFFVIQICQSVVCC